MSTEETNINELVSEIPIEHFLTHKLGGDLLCVNQDSNVIYCKWIATGDTSLQPMLNNAVKMHEVAVALYAQFQAAIYTKPIGANPSTYDFATIDQVRALDKVGVAKALAEYPQDTFQWNQDANQIETRDLFGVQQSVLDHWQGLAPRDLTMLHHELVMGISIAEMTFDRIMNIIGMYK